MRAHSRAEAVQRRAFGIAAQAQVQVMKPVAKTYLREIGLNSSQLTYRCRHAEELKQTVISMLKNNTSGTRIWNSRTGTGTGRETGGPGNAVHKNLPSEAVLQRKGLCGACH